MKYERLTLSKEVLIVEADGKLMGVECIDDDELRITVEKDCEKQEILISALPSIFRPWRDRIGSKVKININIVLSRMKSIRKKEKRL